MNVHEQIDRIGAWSPRQKVIAGAVIIGVLTILAFGLMYAGYRVGTDWADSEYLRKSAEREKRIAVLEANAERHIKNEAQLAAENSLLRKQNQAVAEILDQRDRAQAAEEARKFTELANERNKRYQDIDTDADYDSQLCGLCAEASRSGHKLGESLCGRCKGSS